ncbi:DUF3316 domain-containing protein [Aliivibrio salmonicida]|uniref:Exported protein n=1 Tax=Aliivibrio salmonicida (strain LFI1238) TaxID=316275 RepID=B6EQH7_ALISL|nr:DUF3316 domain-containing protein [Aliivibrio salmonicida]AZL86383.1 DUF3316 domain-containing protein [Aliivibrio salmonicida]CAQ80950.1 putative exported protein [Aliivibrio salmonicida LFI1238]
MKSLKTLALSAVIILASSNAMANPAVISGHYLNKASHTILHTDHVTTKQAAYNQALTQLNKLDNSSPSELQKILKVDSQNVQLDNQSYITVKETMNMQGQIQYTGLIHANYHYLEPISN